MKTIADILAEHRVFGELPEPHRTLISGCASNVVFGVGEAILQEGAEARQFYLVRRGKVGVELNAPAHAAITVQTLGAGDLLGWSWLIPPYRWPFDARALEVTHAIRMDGECLRTKCEADHELGYELLTRFARILAGELEATRIQLLDLYETVE